MLRVLGRHLWPKGERDLRVRVVAAAGAAGPGQARQRLRADPLQACRRRAGRAKAQVVAVPIALILAYGFGPGAGPGVRRSARRDLRAGRRSGRSATSRSKCSTISTRSALRFHLERQTGGLSRVIERGTQGMEFLIRFTTFNILPTLFEIALVGGDPVDALRLALHGGHPGRDRGLHRVLGHPVGMAHQVRAPHERCRHRGQRQGDRQPAELRDRQVLRQRGARGAALRRRPPPLRGGGDPLQPHAVAAQHRPGLDHLGRPGRGHGDGGLRRRRTAA